MSVSSNGMPSSTCTQIVYHKQGSCMASRPCAYAYESSDSKNRWNFSRKSRRRSAFYRCDREHVASSWLPSSTRSGTSHIWTPPAYLSDATIACAFAMRWSKTVPFGIQRRSLASRRYVWSYAPPIASCYKMHPSKYRKCIVFRVDGPLSHAIGVVSLS